MLCEEMTKLQSWYVTCKGKGESGISGAVGWAAVVGLWGSVERHLMVEGVSVQGMLGAGLRVPCFQRGWQCCLFLWASLRLWDEG